MKSFLILCLLVPCMLQCRYEAPVYTTIFPGKPDVPASVLKEHAYLLEEVRALTAFPDSAGLVAEKMYGLMQFHFKAEEDYVLPPLGVLPLMASDSLPEKHVEIRQLTEAFASRMAQMSAEHQKIMAHMEELKRVATKEDLPGILEIEKRLHAHATLEEEILFPAVLVIGAYLEMKSR